MLYTPAALELALRWPLTMPLSSGGEDDKPEMAESTLVRGSTVSADMMLMIEARSFTNLVGLGLLQA